MNKLELLVQNEAFALGSILHDGSLIEETKLKSHHMIEPANKALFQAMLSLKEAGEEVTPLSIMELGESVQSGFGGSSYLSQLMSCVPSVGSFKSYEKHILNYHIVKAARERAGAFLEITKETHNVRDLMSFIHRIVELETETAKQSMTFAETLEERQTYHRNTPQKGLSGVNTGFLKLNEITDGWQDDLIVLAARPSVGKTAFVLNMILNACKKSPVYPTFFSIEMAKGLVIDRMIAMEGKLNLAKLRNPNRRFTEADWAKYEQASQVLKALEMDIREENNVPDMRAVLRRNMKEFPNKKHFAIIDFLTLMKSTSFKTNRHLEVEEIVLDLKQLTKDLGIPVIALAQLNRKMADRKQKEKRPMLSDLRESGSIEQTADIIAFLHREDYVDNDNQHAIPGLTELIIAKHRNGPIGKLKYQFAKETNLFYER